MFKNSLDYNQVLYEEIEELSFGTWQTEILQFLDTFFLVLCLWAQVKFEGDPIWQATKTTPKNMLNGMKEKKW